MNDKNDILRRLRYALKLRDKNLIDIFKNVEVKVSESQISAWLKDDEEGYQALEIRFAES